MPRPSNVFEADARAMVRLVAEVAALNSDHATAKRRLMTGLTGMIGADAWAWTLSYLHPERPPVYVSVQHGGFDEDRFARFMQATEHPDMKELHAPFARELMIRRTHLTRLRQQIDSVNRFPSTDAYRLWLAADVAPLILSARPLNDECVSLIGVYRRADQPLFNERDRAIAHIVLTEVSWLHGMGWPEDFGIQAPLLTSRGRLVLNLLLEGYSRKSLADKLGLSVHTISDHIKKIYATFEVQSHAELMRRFTPGRE